ncbi:hypothetical protein J2Y55_002159 [Bosea sp. BE125]|nr:hypothetical protein [Bosea sp. BE125]
MAGLAAVQSLAQAFHRYCDKALSGHVCGGFPAKPAQSSSSRSRAGLSASASSTGAPGIT